MFFLKLQRNFFCTGIFDRVCFIKPLHRSARSKLLSLSADSIPVIVHEQEKNTVRVSNERSSQKNRTIKPCKNHMSLAEHHETIDAQVASDLSRHRSQGKPRHVYFAKFPSGQTPLLLLRWISHRTNPDTFTSLDFPQSTPRYVHFARFPSGQTLLRLLH